MTAVTYPVSIEGRLDQHLSRWLWLVKWLLAIPHVLVLVFLWTGFVVLSLVAFVAILFTGRYPRTIFDYNVGVLRWTWRVGYYSYSALGTDRYPPFTLDEVPDYPAHLTIDYPDHLSRGLVLVKWWLLAIPHYLVVGFFLGGGLWAADRYGGPGLIGVLVAIAGILLLFTGRYPASIFDLVLGMNRWALRVAAYAGGMTDQYPPFRLDMGGDEPAGRVVVPAPEEPAPPQPPRDWGPGRVTALVIGCILALLSLCLVAGGAVLTWADQTQRNDAGFVTTPSESLSTDSYALVSEVFDVEFDGPDWLYADEILGKVQVSARPGTSASRLFVGIAPEDDAARYLSGVEHGVVTDVGNGVDGEDIRIEPGARAPARPGDRTFWVASAAGAGRQTVTWEVEDGSWTVVVMNADATRAVDADVRVGAELPVLDWLAPTLLVAGLLAGGAAATLVFLAVRRG